MSGYKKIGGHQVFCIEEEPEDVCEYCGRKAELRPYGKNGARICFQCGMAHREETHRNFGLLLRGAPSEVEN